MNPKTPYGWYNLVVRGYPYNEKTAYLLDQNFNPNRRLLSTLVDQKKEFKFKNRRIIRRIMGS